MHDLEVTSSVIYWRIRLKASAKAEEVNNLTPQKLQNTYSNMNTNTNTDKDKGTNYKIQIQIQI